MAARVADWTVGTRILVAVMAAVAVSWGGPSRGEELIDSGVESTALTNVAAEAAPLVDEGVGPVEMRGVISGRNATFDIAFNVTNKGDGRKLVLLSGDVAAERLNAGAGSEVVWSGERKGYEAVWGRRGEARVEMGIAARVTQSEAAEGNAWRRAAFATAGSARRSFRIEFDQTNSEVRVTAAVGVERTEVDGKLVVSGLLPPGRDVEVQWRPTVGKLDAELVVSAEASVVARVVPGAVRVDHLFAFDIAQGELRGLRFEVGEGLSVTAVRGEHLRDWRLEEAAGGGRQLVVTLSRPKTGRYVLQVVGEAAVASLPAKMAVAVVRPVDGGAVEGGEAPAEPMRVAGQLAIGADGAVRVVVDRAAGLSQIDGGAFVHRVGVDGAARELAARESFFYAFASASFGLDVSLEVIVPTFDAAYRAAVMVREDDVTIDAAVELDVRDAPLRSIELIVPGGFLVTAVTGEQVSEFLVREGGEAAGERRVEVRFGSPVMGRVVVSLRLERGSGAIGETLAVGAISAAGAASHRGYIVLAAERGVEVGRPVATELREVHTDSAPMRVAGATHAYRLASAAWRLEIAATGRAAGIRAEVLEVISIGEGLAYGSAAVNYFITGAPVDELTFTMPAELQHVEFVGSDVRRWEAAAATGQNGQTYTVHLSRKVIGDYNVGVVYRQTWSDGSELVVGGVKCEGVETETGYVVVASELNLELTEAAGMGTLLAIDRAELPANYRLLIGAPMLASWKHVSGPHVGRVTVGAYPLGDLPRAVIELTRVETEISIGGDETVESVTRVRYKLKNAASQFLDLSIPAGARVWGATLIEGEGEMEGERRSRVAASVDGATGRLMVPLPRHRNPNEPITVEVEYGRSHGTWSSAALELDAPGAGARSTFTGWTVRGPRGWAVLDATNGAGGVGEAEDRYVRMGSLGAVVDVVGRGWGGALEGAMESGAAWWAGLAAVGVVIGVAMWRRRAAWGAAAIVVCALLVLLGMAASRSGTMNELRAADDLTAMTFTQPVTGEGSAGLRAAVELRPAWRQHTGLAEVAAAGLTGVVLIGAAVWLRSRRVVMTMCAAAGVAALAWAAGRFDVIELRGGARLEVALWLGWALTWGVPVMLLVYAVARVKPWRWVAMMQGAAGEHEGGKGRGAVTAGLAALSLLGAMSAGAMESTPKPLIAGVIERVNVEMTVEGETMRAVYRIEGRAAEPAVFDLYEASAVRVGDASVGQGVEAIVEDGRHKLKVTKAGRVNVELTFLLPIGEAGADLSRRFELGIPAALSNRVTLRLSGQNWEIGSPSAVWMRQSAEAGGVVGEGVFAPGEKAVWTWKPREREAGSEPTVFFAETASVVRFDAGSAVGHHRVALQIAQGQLRELRLRVPGGMTVAAVEGAGVGAWRFDPAGSVLEVRLNGAVSGRWDLNVVTQTAGRSLPWEATVEPLVVEGAQEQRAVTGLASTEAVYLEATIAAETIAVEDFVREAGELLKRAGVGAATVRQAFGSRGAAESAAVRVLEVQPELRAVQSATLTITDERMVFNGELAVDVLKAGVFFIDLSLPGDFDIDSLSAEEVSHWDETLEGGRRAVRVHLKSRLMGRVVMRMTLSRAVTDMPQAVEAPRVEVIGAVKHGGRLIVGGERGLRLSVAARDGVSELNPAALGIRGEGVMAFSLLRPAWGLTVGIEVLTPRIQVEHLHTATVSEGLVRHEHQLRYAATEAGLKVLELQLPAGVTGLQIAGPQIANMAETAAGSGLWRIELAGKWFDRVYPLTVRYESRFDMAAGSLALAPLTAVGAELYRGHIAIKSGEKVQLDAAAVGAELQRIDARTIPRRLGGGELSDAAMAFATVNSGAALTIGVRRHGAADVLEAEVLMTRLTSVANEVGRTVNRLEMNLRVGSRRNLSAALPAGSVVWMLQVNQKAVRPATVIGAGGEQRLLIPLAPGSEGEMPVRIDLLYATAAHADWREERPRYEGPRFDLPLRDIRWVIHSPAGYTYREFEGTLRVDDEALATKEVRRFDLDVYQTAQVERLVAQNSMAVDLQNRGKELAQAGEQYAAKQALEFAYRNSFNDAALNEDALVQLHRQNRQQVMVGLNSRRAYLRPAGGAAGLDGAGRTARDLGDKFSEEEARQELGALDEADLGNLEQIADRMIASQEAAETAAVPLDIQMAMHGRVLAFERALAVEADEPMVVSFEAERVEEREAGRGLGAAAALFAGLALVLGGLGWVTGRGSNGNGATASVDTTAAPTESIEEDATGE